VVETYVALLHSIVLSPGKRVVMADLKAMAEGLGLRNVRTLAATGNLVFEGEAAPLGEIEARLEAGFRTSFGKHVDIIARTAEGWKRLAAGNPFPQGNGADVVVRAMRAPLDGKALARLESHATPGIRLALSHGDLWIDFAAKPSETKLLAHLTTKKLGIGTLRNANTVNGLCALLAR